MAAYKRRGLKITVFIILQCHRQGCGNGSAGRFWPRVLGEAASENGCGLDHLKGVFASAPVAWLGNPWTTRAGTDGTPWTSLSAPVQSVHVISSMVASELSDLFYVGAGSAEMCPVRGPYRS